MHLYLFREFFALPAQEQERQWLRLSRWDYPSVQIICFRYNPDNTLREKWKQWFPNGSIRVYWHHPLLHPLDFHELMTNLLSESASLHVVCCNRLRWKILRTLRSGASAPLLHFDSKGNRKPSSMGARNPFTGPGKKGQRKSSR